jgi:AraC-like DNA-binding protein
MYYPIQIPYILDKAFSEAFLYAEEIVPDYQDFLICLWSIQPLTDSEKTVNNIIIADGCIDLVANYKEKRIDFIGMSKTNFEFKIDAQSCYIGARLKPGAFHAITNIPASEAMDTFLPLNTVDKNFDTNSFFALTFSEAKEAFKNYIGNLIQDKKPSEFITLFNELNKNIPNTVAEIYQKMYYSPRQCQRLFVKNYGLSPQMILCILRFQECLQILTSGKATKEVMDIHNYYDQAHFINDFKRNIGLTPLELVRKYTSQ